MIPFSENGALVDIVTVNGKYMGTGFHLSIVILLWPYQKIEMMYWIETFLKKNSPYGKVLVAVVDEKVVGCVAYHRHNNKRCEMKRLYVLPAYRGLRIGQKLVEEIMEIVKQDGYTEMVLDTIEPLYCAISLYKKCGFKERKAYYDNPMEDVIYMQCCLS